MAKRQSVSDMSWEELGRLFEGMSFAARPVRAATDRITDRFSLGPRGAWILTLISGGHVFPLEIANFFGVGRSLITAELSRLLEAGLIEMRASEVDRRRTELTLTEEGKRTQQLMREELARAARERLAGFTREEVLTCTRVLLAFQGSGQT